MGHFTDILFTKSKNFQWLLAIVMVALIGVLEYRTEPTALPCADLSATWFAGRHAGIFKSCIRAAVWVLAIFLATSGEHASMTFYWNALTQLGIFHDRGVRGFDPVGAEKDPRRETYRFSSHDSFFRLTVPFKWVTLWVYR
jgi:hypothetical protein